MPKLNFKGEEAQDVPFGRFGPILEAQVSKYKHIVTIPRMDGGLMKNHPLSLASRILESYLF